MDRNRPLADPANQPRARGERVHPTEPVPRKGKIVPIPSGPAPEAVAVHRGVRAGSNPPPILPLGARATTGAVTPQAYTVAVVTDDPRTLAEVADVLPDFPTVRRAVSFSSGYDFLRYLAWSVSRHERFDTVIVDVSPYAKLDSLSIGLAVRAADEGLALAPTPIVFLTDRPSYELAEGAQSTPPATITPRARLAQLAAEKRKRSGRAA